MQIRPPRFDQSHPDYMIECGEAIDVAFRELVDAAIVSGWRPESVFDALACATINHQLAYAADPDPADDR